MQMAALLKAPEMMLDQAEAEALARSGIEVMRHYPVKADPKLRAWGGLFFTAATIYGPRIMVIRQRLRAPPRPAGDSVEIFAN